MPTRKKNTSKRSKSKTVSAKAKSKAAAKKRTASASARNKKANSGGKKIAKKKASGSSRKQTRKQPTDAAFSQKVFGVQSGRQSGDMQGLSRGEAADSESVDELLEEGNAFEAGVVKGVEDAEDHEEKSVRTHEVPEDDVPEEYLDKD